jgi:hypothetical protein
MQAIDDLGRCDGTINHLLTGKGPIGNAKATAYRRFRNRCASPLKEANLNQPWRIARVRRRGALWRA